MRTFSILATLIFTLMCSCTNQSTRYDTGVSHELATWRKGTIKELQYAIDIDLVENIGKVYISFSLPKSEEIIVDFRATENILDVKLNGGEVEHKIFNEHIIIPKSDINLTQILLVGFDRYFAYIRASWLSPVIAVALAFGVLAGVLTWVSGPSKGIFAVGRAGYLPPFFQKTNENGVQRNILLIQGALVTLLGLLFVVMPSVQSFYQILSQLTVLLYLIMYLLMFAAAIYLRYSMKKAERPFRIGGKGNGLMWIIGGLGFLGSLLAFILSFIPPGQIAVGSKTMWYAVLVIGCVVVVVIPLIIYALRKPSWKDPSTNFEPFHWEESKQS